MMVDLGLLAHHTAPVVGCFFNGSSSVAKLVTPVAALLLRKMLRKLDLKHGEAHAAQRRAVEPPPTTAARLDLRRSTGGLDFPGKVDTEIRAMRGSNEVIHGKGTHPRPPYVHSAVQA